MLGRDWRALRAVARTGLIILAVALGASDCKAGGEKQNVTAHAASQPVAIHSPPTNNRAPYNPNCQRPATEGEANYCQARKSADAGQRQDDLSYVQLVVNGVATILLLLTLAFTAKAANAARDAANALPVLERAYVYSHIVSEDTPSVLQNALRPNAMDPNPDFRPTVGIVLQNFGKTPARLVTGEISLFFHQQGALAPQHPGTPISYKHVLGEGEPTPTARFQLEHSLTVEQARDVLDGSARLILYGSVTYLDVWGRSDRCEVLWVYRPELRRMAPDTDGTLTEAPLRPKRKRAAAGQHVNAFTNPPTSD